MRSFLHFDVKRVKLWKIAWLLLSTGSSLFCCSWLLSGNMFTWELKANLRRWKDVFFHLPGENIYDSIATVGKIRVWWRADFQSGSRVLKKVFWTLSYLYLWHTMWFHAKKLLRTLKFWKSLNSLCKSGSRPQKSPKKAQKTDHSIAIYSNFWIGMVYFGYHLVKAHVQTVQNMYGKGG